MPIRFRCAYCNQLLGIARRKAGTVVRCPGCSGQVVVPSLEEAGLTAKEKSGSGPFEGNEIDKMLEGTDQPSVVQPGAGPVLASQYAGAPPTNPPRAPGATMSAPQAPAPAPPIIPPPAPAGPRPPGIVLSPAKATLLSVGMVVALAIAFGSGLLVGLLLALRQQH